LIDIKENVKFKFVELRKLEFRGRCYKFETNK